MNSIINKAYIMVAKTKHENIRESILEAIRVKKYLPGKRLPSERKLAEQYDVSYMTARKVVAGLVESEFLERKDSSNGVYVRSTAVERISTTTLHLICTAFETQATCDFINLGNLAAERRGWRPHVIRFHHDLLRPAILALRSGEPCLAWVDERELQGTLWREILMAEKNVVLIGNHKEEVSTVMLDDADAVRQAVQHLRAMGHEKIGMVTADPRLKVEIQRLAAWRNCFEDVNADFLYQRAIHVYVPPFERSASHAYKATVEYLKDTTRDKVTAFICSGDEIALGVMAAYRESGFSVPNDISIINHGDSNMMRYSNPPVTCIDLNFEGHISEAIKILEKTRNEKMPKKRHSLIAPVLVKRNSVSRISGSRK